MSSKEKKPFGLRRGSGKVPAMESGDTHYLVYAGHANHYPHGSYKLPRWHLKLWDTIIIPEEFI